MRKSSLLSAIKRNNFATLLVRNEKNEILVGMHLNSGHLVLPSVSMRKRNPNDPELVRNDLASTSGLCLGGNLHHKTTLNYRRLTKDHISNVHNHVWEVSWTEDSHFPKPSAKGPYKWMSWLAAEDIAELAFCPTARKSVSHAVIRMVIDGVIE